MHEYSTGVPRSRRLNPFAFPSDTDLRFVLLIVTVIGASLFIYNRFCLNTHFQEFLASLSCALRQRSNVDQNILAQSVSALQTADNAARQCEIAYQRISTAYMIGGVALVEAVAVVIYWLFPFWNLWRGKLVLLSAEDSPELMTYLAELCREAQLARLPSFVCNPFNQTITGLAFGRVGRYYVALSGGLVTLFSTDQASFRAIVLHELAHLHNADVNKTYFALATWWAFVIVALVPFTAFDVISAVRFSEDRYLLLNDAWRVLVMAVLVFLVLVATLRAREFYADVRATIWENSTDPLLRVLTRLEMPKKRWQRVTHVHPDPRERGRTLNETDRLFRMGLWEALGFGIAIGIAAPNVLALVNSLLSSLPQIAPSDIYWQPFGAALILAPLLAVAAGLSTWRTTFAALVQGQVLPSIGRAGLCVGIGLILGTFLSLSNNGRSWNPLFLFLLSLPWSLVALVSLFLFLSWIAMGTSAWLDVMISSRSPRLFYTVGLVMASGVLVVVLAQLFRFYLIAEDIAGLLAFLNKNTPSDLLIGFAIVIVGSILLLIYNILVSPGMLVAFICLWAFPLAAWFWRKQMTAPVESHWAFLGVSSQPVVLPRQDPFRLRFALTVGLVGGLVFCGLWLMIRILVHLSVPETIRGTDLFKLLFFYGTIVLPALLQAGIAGITVGRVRRLGSLHGLFAAFVGGCVMTVGFLGINLLFGGGIDLYFAWITLTLVVTGGALLAVPTALCVSVLIRWASATSPQQRAFPSRFAIILGLLGGLAFCVIALVISVYLTQVIVALYVFGSTTNDSTYLLQLRPMLLSNRTILAVLFQAATAAIVTARVKQWRVLQGLLATLIAGCVMLVGILAADILLGDLVNVSLILLSLWYVVVSGMLLALPISLFVFLLTGWRQQRLLYQRFFYAHLALRIGLMSGLTFCLFVLVFTICLPLIIPAKIGSTAQFGSMFYFSQVSLAVLIQPVIAAIAACRVRRLSFLYGLLAAFAGGCAMVVGVVISRLLYIGIKLSLGWLIGFINISMSTFFLVIIPGVALSLPIALVVSLLAMLIRRLRRNAIERAMTAPLA